jgi:type VI secretion system protein ImpM
MQTGFYGKLPTLGDFVMRRVSAEFVETWDRWLQQGIAGARAQFGGDWNARYGHSAPWRFAFEAGVCGPGAVLGVMLASSDRVGRQFPMTVACELAPGWPALETATRAGAWYAAVESELLRAVSGSYDIDAFDRVAAGLDSLHDCLEPAAADLQACEQVLSSHGAFRLPLQATGLAGSLAAMSAGRLARSAAPLAMFWCESTSTEPQLLASRGLPAPAVLADMLCAMRVAAATVPAMQESALPSSAVPQESAAGLEPAPELARRSQVLAHDGQLRCYGVFAVAGPDPAQLDTLLTDINANLTVPGLDPDACVALLGDLLPVNRLETAADAGAHFAVCLADDAGPQFAWQGAGAIFRLRDRELVRLSPDVVAAPAGGSLMDLLNSTAEVAAPVAHINQAGAPGVVAGDRYLLCTDAAFTSLSWGQLVSALDEEDPAYGVDRLRDALGERAAEASPALIVIFESGAAGLAIRSASSLTALPGVAA